jgi:hypothetical protein
MSSAGMFSKDIHECFRRQQYLKLKVKKNLLLVVLFGYDRHFKCLMT